MKLKRFLLRYYPPGIILEYVRKNGEQETKSIDLLNLSSEYLKKISILLKKYFPDLLILFFSAAYI
jgi:hypothetical protein